MDKVHNFKIKNIRLSVLLNLLSMLIVVFIYTFIKDYLKDLKLHSGLIAYQINIALGFTAAASISLSYIAGNLKKLDMKRVLINTQKIKYFGFYGFFIALIHVFLSLVLIGKVIYPYLYELNGILNTYGQLTILCGVTSIGLLLMPALTSISSVKSAMATESWKKYQQIGYYALITTMGHIISQEIFKIFMISEWKYCLIPESIFIFFIILTALFLKIVVTLRRKN